MQINSYTSATEFLARAQQMLERHEGANNVIIGVANTLSNPHERFREFHLVTVDDSSGVRIAGLMTPPDSLIIHAEVPDVEAMSALARHFYAQNVAVRGVLGMVESAHTFAEAWINVAGGSWSVKIHERL